MLIKICWAKISLRPTDFLRCRSRRRTGPESAVHDIQLVGVSVVMDFVDSRSCKVRHRSRCSTVFQQRTGISIRTYQDRQRGGSPCRDSLPKVEEEAADIVAPIEGVIWQLYRNILRADRDVRARYGVEVVTSQIRVSEE